MKKFFAVAMAAAMVAGMFAGCGSSKAPADPKVIKIGTSAPLTGGAAVYGTAVEAGMKIAVNEINAQAEANSGLKIEFKAMDDEHDTEKATNAYNSLKDWGMQIMAGCITTAPCNTIAPLAAEDQMFMMTPSGSAESIALAGSNVMQMCFTDPNQGANAAVLMAEKSMGQAIGIIYDSSDEYSSGLVKGFKAKASELKLNIVCETSFTDATKTDLTTQVTQCKEAGCDLVFLPFYCTEASQVLTYAAKIGYAPTFFGCDGMDGILAVEGFNPALAEDLVMMTPFNADATDEKTRSFVSEYKKMMNGQIPNQFAADGYDVIYAVYNACVASGVDGEMSHEDVCAKLVEYFGSATFNGLTGNGLTWDVNGMVSKIPAAVKIQNGIYVSLS